MRSTVRFVIKLTVLRNIHKRVRPFVNDNFFTVMKIRAARLAYSYPRKQFNYIRTGAHTLRLEHDVCIRKQLYVKISQLIAPERT